VTTVYASDVHRLSGLPSGSPEEELYVHHVRSVVWNGKRVRAIWNHVHLRPLSETFHEFLVNVVMWTLGEQWWKHQRAMAEPSRHAVMAWQDAFAEATRRPPQQVVTGEHSSRFATVPSGPAVALLSLGYDFFCLQAADRLPGFLVERLRRHRDFQSARYEVAVAATMVRAGFQIEFLDDSESNAKRCDLVASNADGGVRLAVEAKSRVRPGVLHSRGEFEYDGEPRGLLRLLRDACRQSIDGLPLVIFVDVNAPPTPHTSAPEKNWVRDMNEAADDLERRMDQQGGRDLHALIVATNFGFHFGSIAGTQSPIEFGLLAARRPAVGIGTEWLNRIAWSVARYGRVPPGL
jgi:hypothetical protein